MHGGSWVTVDGTVDSTVAKLTPTAKWVEFSDRGTKCYVRSPDAVAVRQAGHSFDGTGTRIDH